MGGLVYEVGLEPTLPPPISMETVLPNGRRIGTVRRNVGVRDAITTNSIPRPDSISDSP